MDKQINKLVKAFGREKGKVIAFFNGLDEGDFSTEVYADGQKWTIRQILAHFLESEISLRTLIAKMVEEDWPGVSEDFDLDKYNEEHNSRYDQLPVVELIDQFEAEREETIRKVSGWTQADLEKEGRHPFLGVVKVGEMLKLMYLHHTIHMRDIRNVLNTD